MRFPTKSALLSVPLLMLGLPVLLGGRAEAAWGDGQIVGDKLDLLVYFTYPETDPASWEPAFEEYSKLLLNATEGGLQLGTVEFTTCAALADEADIWVLNDFSGARAHIGGLGRSGQHITISQTHRSVSGAALGYFGLAHETGHYVWALYDEYLGFVGGFPATSSLHYCSTVSGTSACLMDGGTTVFPNNQRTEYCTDVTALLGDTKHNSGAFDSQGRLVRTDQEYVYSTSCWRQIQRNGNAGLQHPTSTPMDVDLPHDPVNFVTDRLLGTLSMALLVDTSGSMSGDSRLESAIQGSQLALGMLRDGETEAVYAFDDRLRTLVSPEIVNASRRSAAISKVGQLQAGGGTEAGDALLDVAKDLRDVEGCRKFVVLLTDGVSDEPDVNAAEVLLELQSNEVLVYPVALGSFPDDAALMDLASATGGQYFYAPRPEDIPAIFAEIFVLAGGGTSLGSLQGPGAPIGELTSMDVEVPESANSLVVALAASAESGPLLGLVGPQGEAIRSDSVLSGSGPLGVEVVQAGDVLLLRVPEPSAGIWELGFVTLNGTAPGVTLVAAAESRLLSITTGTDEDVVPESQAVRIVTSVVSAVPVAGASVQGFVERPDGARIPIRLHDDGHPASGDLQAGDGVYSAYFAEYAGQGLYRFDLTVNAQNGVAASNRECGRFGLGTPIGELREEGGSTRFIAPFRAQSSHTILVQGDSGMSGAGVAELLPSRVEPNATEGSLVAFDLAIGSQEPLSLNRVEFLLGSDAGSLEGAELHLDRDRDGCMDRPRRALATARVEGDRLIFEHSTGSLALLGAGEEIGFVLALDEPLREALPTTVGGSMRSFEKGRVPSWKKPWLTSLAMLFFVCLLLRRPKHVPAMVRPVLALLVVSLPLSQGCFGPETRSREEVLLEPSGLDLKGATTGERVEVKGETLVLEIRR